MSQQTVQQPVKKLALKPLGNRVLAKALAHPEKMKGGIIIPDSAKKKQETAQVIAVGPGKRLEDGTTVAIPLNIGDTILMDKYSGQEVSIDNEDYIILKADDIIAIIEN